MELEVSKGVSLFLGAGASCDYGFPTGKQLMWDIVESLSNCESTGTGHYLREYSNYDNAALGSVGQDLHNALQQKAFDSIDAYLDQRRHSSPETLEICRQAVWCLILEYEQKAELYPYDDWMLDFFKLFFNEAQTAYGAREIWNPVGSERVGISIYTLNYDRLFEWKLFSYLKGRFGDTSEVGEHLAAIEGLVTHSHGSLGQITSETKLPFGAQFPKNQDTFLSASEKIKFWFEMSPEHWTWDISILFGFRETLLMLGYGFHPSINSRFDPNRSPDSKLSRIYSTCFGNPEAKRKEVSSWISKRFVIDIESLSMGSEMERCSDVIQMLAQPHATATN